MRFGIFSNGQRLRDTLASYDDDIHEMVTAEQAGFEEVWISEHTGHHWMPMAVPAAELLIAKAAALTQRIRFGPAVRRISLYPPQMVAIEAAVCDHLTHGRYMFGFGVGPRVTNYPHWGIDEAKAAAMTTEAIDLILKCWNAKAPFDYDGAFYKGKGIDIYPKPLQSPLPVAVATANPQLLEMAASHHFRVLTTWSSKPDTVRKIGADFDEACIRTHGAPRRSDLTAIRAVYVADTDSRASEDVEADWSRQLAHNKQFLTPTGAAYVSSGGQQAEMTFKKLVDDGNIIVGSPATVIDRITAFHNHVGGFGTFLLVAGRDIATKEQRDRMFHLFAEAVAPKLANLVSQPKSRVAEGNS